MFHDFLSVIRYLVFDFSVNGHNVPPATTSNVKSAVRSLPSCWNCPHAPYRPGFGKFARKETGNI
jgi:hypothetical protein